MLGTTQSTKFKVEPVYLVLRDAGSIMTTIFFVITAALYFFMPEYRTASIISSLFMVAFTFPILLYFFEDRRVETKRLKFRDSISNN
jgi:hypothetical protein